MACMGDTVLVQVSNQQTVAYQWDFDGATVASGTGAGPYQLVWNNDGTHTVHLQAGAGNCSSSSAQSITVMKMPLLTIPPADNSVCGGDTVQLVITTDAANQVQWLPGNNYQLIATTGSTALVCPSQNCEVAVEVTDANGCSAAGVIPVVATNSCCQLVMPGAFTPNRDGVNDVFRPKGNGYQLLSFIIYNRWGQVVFSSHKNNEGWNGTFNGQNQGTGTYIYTVQYQCLSTNKVQQLKGSLMLVR